MLIWEEDTSNERSRATQDMVDLSFSIECRQIPVDHAYSLCQGLQRALPWLRDDERVGVHQIHGASSQNGWERPSQGGGQLLQLSRRTRLTLRVPAERVEEAMKLSGALLDIDGHPLGVGEAKLRPLSLLTTIFARYLVCEADDDESTFLRRVAGALEAKGIRVKKALSGMPNVLGTAAGPVHTRSLLLADLRAEDSLKLQREGLGPHRNLGCGIFIPHKGIAPVKKVGED